MSTEEDEAPDGQPHYQGRLVRVILYVAVGGNRGRVDNHSVQDRIGSKGTHDGAAGRVVVGKGTSRNDCVDNQGTTGHSHYHHVLVTVGWSYPWEVSRWQIRAKSLQDPVDLA